MDQAGLWRLFFLTGLPEAYLALRGEEQQRRTREYELARTAFVPKPPLEIES